MLARNLTFHKKQQMLAAIVGDGDGMGQNKGVNGRFLRMFVINI